MKDASSWAGITADSKPKDLNPEELVRVYEGFMRQSYYLGRVGGLEALDSLRDVEVAASLFDTLFRNGNRGGGNAIRKAINTVDPGRVAPSGDLDMDTFEAYRAFTDDCDTRQQLLDALAEERKKQYDDEGARFDHFRFRNSSECRDAD